MMPLSDIFAAVRWWAVLMVLGAAATPLAFTLFRRLPDRGYAFVKLLGLLVVAYLFWILTSIGFLGNNVGSMLVALLGLAALSAWLYRRRARRSPGETLLAWLRANRRQVLLTELVFAAIFAVWVWVRAQNPAIAATEKPMEFAFLNAIDRSSTFPPLDPWLSNFAISYYYFGYVMTSLIARLAAVAEPVAFNLGIAWLVAGTAVGAFGLVYNLLASQGWRRTAVALGLVATLALPLAGNLEVVLELAHGNNVGTAAFWQWLDVRELNQAPAADAPPRYTSTGWWWWRSSRVIHEYHLSGRPEEGLEPIAEFPGFSFVLGDMHPHVLALPFAFLSLAVAFVWFLEGGAWRLTPGAWSLARLRAFVANPLLWLFTALVLGGLSFLNTWDVLIHLFVVLGAFLLARWRSDGWHRHLLGETAVLALLLIIPAVLMYLPFYLGFRSQAGAPYLLPMLMRPTRLAHFLIIFGMPLWVITILLLALGLRQRFRHWQLGLATAVSLILGLFLLTFLFGWIVASSAESLGRITNLAAELGIALPPRPDQPLSFGWGVQVVFAVLPALVVARLAYPATILLLAAVVGFVVMIWREVVPQAAVATEETAADRPVSTLPFALLLIATAALLTLGPEFIYLRDNFGFRLNTVFKFYYQAWVLFGVGALFGLGYLWRAWRGRTVPALASAGYALALTLALLFPVLAVNSRAQEYRGPYTADSRRPATLNGLAQVAQFNPDEYAAIMWLRENVSGAPVILEAVGGQYSEYGRVSASTGLPTVLGWAGHEYQWRGTTPEPGERDPAVREIYSTRDLTDAAALLNRYGVDYIYVGGLERNTYGEQGLDKFAEQLEVVYSNASVTIYRWQPTETVAAR